MPGKASIASEAPIETDLLKTHNEPRLNMLQARRGGNFDKE
jgi:hypothetical protein